MRRIITVFAVAGVWLTLGGSAAALCTCGELESCNSAEDCRVKRPGDECGNQRTCKIIVGSADAVTCCCGCSRGLGPKGCDYAAVGPVQFPADVGCGSKALARLAGKVEQRVNGNLAQAEAACRKEKNALKKANRARSRLTRLWKKIEHAATKGKIDQACATASLGLIEGIRVRIDDVEGGNGTTSTTLPYSPTCWATFLPFPAQDEVEFHLGCTDAGTEYQGFQLTLNGGRKVENFLEPAGFVCTITSENDDNDSLKCVGVFAVDVQVTGGRVRTSPAPEAGMNANLFVRVGDARYGPFPTTGP